MESACEETVPAPSSGFFLRRHHLPNPVALLDTALRLGQASSVAFYQRAVCDDVEHSLILGERGLDTNDEVAVRHWLRDAFVTESDAIPTALRAAMGNVRALVVPIRTPVWEIGAIALPGPRYRRSQIRALESACSAYALDVELADRELQRELLARELKKPKAAPSERLPIAASR